MILSIESSCDDSSIAITEIDSKKVIFHKKISQDESHTLHGGVVPEIAARLHAEALPKILEECKPYFVGLKAVAVTTSPGLSVTLLEGLIMAKALCMSLGLPLIAIDHLKGHLYSLFIEKEALFPISVLLVSGGHTMIIEARSDSDMRVVASTLDDSFGESFDKCAKMLGLGYPGGPIVEKYAKGGDKDSIELPIPLKDSSEIAFSFSGLKNAVRLAAERYSPLDEQTKKNICASFQKSACEHLANKLKRYFKKSETKSFAIVGGASANLYLRNRLSKLCGEFHKEILFAPLEYCSDNAVMIGRCAIESYKRGDFEDIVGLDISPKSRIFTLS